MGFLKIIAILVISLYGISLLLILLYSIIQFQLLMKYLSARSLPPALPDSIPETSFPRVTVQLPVYNEPLVISRLIDNIIRLEYPAEKLQIQVLDDSTDETRDLCEQKVAYYKAEGIDIVHIHRQDRTGFKAGALQNGLSTATGDLIAIFDADFLPKSDFLRLTIPYFSDQETGVVQTRWGHINEAYSMLTRLQAFQLNLHFSIEQTGREHGDYFLQFNGTAGIWRKATIIDAGGWMDNTLTEDLNLSYRAQLKGWKIHFCQAVDTPAELPVEMIGLKSQQFRWMKGGAENARILIPHILHSTLTLPQQMHAITHLLSSSIFLIVFLLAILSVPVFFLYPFIDIHLQFFTPFLLSVGLLACVYFVANSDTSWQEVSWIKRLFRFVIMFPVFLSLSMGLSYHTTKAILEGYRGKKSPFVRTPKFNIHTRQDRVNKHQAIIQRKTKGIWMEGMLSLYFLCAVVAGIVSQDYSFLIYHLMLVIGFGSIFILTILHQCEQ